MTLANIITQPPTGYLLTDSAWFYANGHVGEFRRKVLELPQQRMALTARGSHDLLAGITREIAVYLGRCRSASAAGLLRDFSEIYAAACFAQGVPGSGREHACDAQLVAFDPDRGRAIGFVIANIVDDFDGLRPFELTPVASLFNGTIDPDAPLGRPIDTRDPGAFDVRRDGLAVADRTRRTPWRCGETPLGHYVGGTINLTTVDANGVRTEALGTYLDWPGQPIDPDAPFLASTPA